MQVFCCGRGRRAQHGRNLSTPVSQLPARPPGARLYGSQVTGQDTEIPMISLDTTQAPSLMTTPRHDITMDPSIFEVEDSDTEVDGGDRTGSGTNTLGHLKAKLARRLSQRQDTRRYSQHTAGSSEDELARRAELRRLRQRRIQEELETEEESESQSKVPDDAQDASGAKKGTAGVTLRNKSDLSISMVEDDKSGTSLSVHSRETQLLALPMVTRTTTSLSRSSSCPESSIQSGEPPVNLEYAAVIRPRGSLPQMPTPPSLQPVHLHSVRGSSSVASWRLSYSASQLADFIGFPDEESISRMGSPPNASVRESRSAVGPPRPVTPTLAESYLGKDDGSPTTLEATIRSVMTEPLDSHNGQERCETSSNKSEIYSGHSSGAYPNKNPDRYSPLELWLRVSNTLQSIGRSSTRRNSDSVLDSRPTSLVADLSPACKTQQLQNQPLTSNSALESTVLKIPGAFPPHGDHSGLSSSPTPGPKEGMRARGAVSLDQSRISDALPLDVSSYHFVEFSNTMVTRQNSGTSTVAAHLKVPRETPSNSKLNRPAYGISF